LDQPIVEGLNGGDFGSYHLKIMKH